jgi:peptidoglycan glycosyltransferase
VTRRRAGRFTGLTILLALMVAACTGDDTPAIPPPADAAEAFVTAWSSEAADAMAAAFDTSTRSRWPATRLERVMTRVLEGGAISSFEVTRSGPIEATSGRATVPVRVIYHSEAARRPARFEGEVALTYAAGAWRVRWDRGLLWPGLDGAHHFETTYRWPRRASIFDRDGDALATGAAEHRSYPFRSVGGNVLGHLETIGGRDGEQLEAGHGRGDLVGGSGLELALQERLAGSPRSTLAVVARDGTLIAELGGRRARRGRPVRTTIDVDVQRAAESAFGSTIGAAVVIDPHKGDVLAAVTSSPFDPQSYVGVAGLRPFSRAMSGLYPPGSAMKVVTAGAALDTRLVTPSTELSGPQEYKGVRNFESGEFGTLDFATAMKFSVNTAFAQVAERLGAARLTRYAERFGFNEAPSMPLEAATSSFPFPEDEGDLLWGSIGQAQVLATPLQMGTVAATVANDGARMEPRITLGTRPEGRRVVTRRTARTLTDLMVSVVAGGTGSAAALSDVTVAGKTGTAEVDVAGKRKNHAWFIAFAPAEDPRVAVALVSELGGVGGRVAAPLARSLLAAVLPLVP